ncbi:pro-thyrotropin-releasing hormone [Megalops cyprinoides]|uniref:pro-thyrotropin-releasing hormone n=1 Tax=Megalops cyprinoides TaxID=118141 RepID=UPI00186467A1|nr:pro-thyrotropin-releasing hormone [Megalops cyprinoides]
MKPAYLILLVSLTVCNLTMNLGQSIPDEENMENRVALDEMLQRADSLLLRSILKKIGDDDSGNELFSSQQEWVSKRQHPGKRYQEDIEKRQHPGKREEGEDQDYSDLQKRQHPGKREDEMDSFVELQRRQHPGKRTALDQLPDSSGSQTAYLIELSKRQHPGKRYLMYDKRQHPGRRELGEETDSGELPDLEKRQHPGKRFLDNTSPDYTFSAPCDIKDPVSCSKASLLLELLDNATKSRAEEKRQHPGKRFAFDEDLTEQE